MQINISFKRQTLDVIGDDGQQLASYTVSTALNGPGELKNSECTPRGAHIIRAKIGQGAAPCTVFRGRRATGEIWSPELAALYPGRDWILSRILWLSGCEPGFNRLGKVDSMQRYIYIHGTPDTEPMGHAASHGCVRMRNDDVIALFDLVPVGTRVYLEDDTQGD
ncbi:MAG TPA: L,D-transpeptidase [Methylovorus sp.]|jgi:L,D-transpeptidase YbiS|nr:L,D-transpeptidase [Methylovorus sp.]